MDTPEWLGTQLELEELSLSPSRLGDVFARALALPHLCSLRVQHLAELLTVPDVFRETHSLRNVIIVGRFADPDAALAALTLAPGLETLEIPGGVSRLPDALGHRTLRSVSYVQPRPPDGPALDLAEAFRVLATTGVASLALTNVKSIPE